MSQYDLIVPVFPKFSWVTPIISCTVGGLRSILWETLTLMLSRVNLMIVIIIIIQSWKPSISCKAIERVPEPPSYWFSILDKEAWAMFIYLKQMVEGTAVRSISFIGPVSLIYLKSLQHPNEGPVDQSLGQPITNCSSN